MAKSAGFPTFSLSEALEKVRRVYEREPHNEMSSEAAAKHLGYSGKSGASLATIATLRRYNLLDGRGEKIRVSRDAVTIFADEKAQDQTERIEALIRCSKSPDIFADLASGFKGIPAIDTLIPTLVKRGFPHGDAAQIASNYVDTMEFVKKASEGYTAPGSIADQQEKTQMNQNASLPVGSRNIQLPLSPTTWATLTAPFPLTDDTWKQMLSILEAMKPALVENKNT